MNCGMPSCHDPALHCKVIEKEMLVLCASFSELHRKDSGAQALYLFSSGRVRMSASSSTEPCRTLGLNADAVLSADQSCAECPGSPQRCFVPGHSHCQCSIRLWLSGVTWHPFSSYRLLCVGHSDSNNARQLDTAC